MVHGQCAVCNTNLHSAAHGELVGVDLWSKAAAGAGLHDPGGIIYGKESLFAENVHKVGERGGLGHHGANGVNIIGMTIPAANGVRAQECAPYQRRNGLFDPVYDTKHLHLVLRVEPVAALDFYSSRALGYHLPHAHHRLREQLVLGRAVQPVCGIENSAAASRDFLVRQAVYLVDKLAVAAARVHYVRMTVAPGWH